MNILQNFIKNIADIDDVSSQKLVDLATIVNFKKNDVVVRAGDLQSNFYILRSGIMKSYYFDKNGKSHIRNFFTAMSTTGDIGALLTKKPAKLFYDYFTDCELYAINYKEFMDMVDKDHEFCKMFSKMLSKIVLIFESKIYDLSVLNATERYLKLRQELPDLEKLVPQYHIASYLNITPTQLSRIRKDIVLKNIS